MALNDQEQKLLDQVLRNAPITNRARDTIRKLYLIAESDVYTVNITNESMTLPASVSGVVSSYADSGTTISVYRGDTQLTGITSGTPTTGQFKVTATATRITAGSQSVTDTHNITFAVSSGLSAGNDTAFISFSIKSEPQEPQAPQERLATMVTMVTMVLVVSRPSLTPALLLTLTPWQTLRLPPTVEVGTKTAEVAVLTHILTLKTRSPLTGNALPPLYGHPAVTLPVRN